MQRTVLTILSCLLATSTASAHGKNKHPKTNLTMVENQFGRTGSPLEVTRTVDVAMHDEMKFAPDLIEITQGETVRFKIKNEGAILHEMVIGTEAELLEHAALMEKFPEMEHAEPFMAHVPEQSNGEIYWTFDKPGDFHYGCLIPGHFQAGMRGKIVVLAKAQSGEASLIPAAPANMIAPESAVAPEVSAPALTVSPTVNEEAPPVLAAPLSQQKPKKPHRASNVAARDVALPPATDKTSRR